MCCAELKKSRGVDEITILPTVYLNGVKRENQLRTGDSAIMSTDTIIPDKKSDGSAIIKPFVNACCGVFANVAIKIPSIKEKAICNIIEIINEVEPTSDPKMPPSAPCLKPVPNGCSSKFVAHTSA